MQIELYRVILGDFSTDVFELSDCASLESLPRRLRLWTLKELARQQDDLQDSWMSDAIHKTHAYLCRLVGDDL